MFRLFLIIYTLASTALAGSAIVVALTINRVDLNSILIAAAIGAIVALPVSWSVAKRILDA